MGVTKRVEAYELSIRMGTWLSGRGWGHITAFPQKQKKALITFDTDPRVKYWHALE